MIAPFNPIPHALIFCFTDIYAVYGYCNQECFGCNTRANPVQSFSNPERCLAE